MTFAPGPIHQLAVYWSDRGGVPLGIVGNAAHVIGYHLGRDRIYAPGGQGGADYSVQLPRDRAGLTDAAAAIDLGKLEGTYAALRMFSTWLVDQCMKDPAVRRDVREIIYSPDGAAVQRYSSVDNAIHHGAGNGDDSHLTHTHISFYRDSEDRDKVGLFAPYFEEVDMKPLPITDQTPMLVTFQQPATFYNLDGSVQSEGHRIPGTATSPYQASNGTNHFRAVYAGPDPVRLILIKPATIEPVPPPDCSGELAPYKTAVDQARDALALVP